MNIVSDVATKLTRESRRKPIDTFTQVEWVESLDPDVSCCFSPEFVSIFGTDEWNDLDNSAKNRVCFYESVNFFSINIHGERHLIADVTPSLHKSWPYPVSAYLHHFIEEENRHMFMFATFCERYCSSGYYPERLYPAPALQYSEIARLFLDFLKIWVFEMVVDAYNRRMAKDERLLPLCRQIHDIHHLDEIRHLAFGRQCVRDLYESHHASWSDEEREGLAAATRGYLEMTWRSLYNPYIYRDAGLPEPFALSRTAWDHPVQRKRRAEIMEPVNSFLLKLGIFATPLVI